MHSKEDEKYGMHMKAASGGGGLIKIKHMAYFGVLRGGL